MKIFSPALGLFMSFILVGCGGGGSATNGGLGADLGLNTTTTAGSITTTTASASSKLFAVDSSNKAIGSVANANLVAGTTVVDRVIMGAGTQLTSLINGLALDSIADRLYVTQDTKILVFDNAGLANGNVAPRVLASSTTAHYSSPFLDRLNDRLYVADPHAQSVYIFNNASTATNAFPARALSFPAGFVNGLTVDVARNILYTRINGSPCRIAVLQNADIINGVVTPDRYIDFCSVNRLLIDSTKDRLYIATHMGTVVIFDNASTINGAATGTSMRVAISGTVTDIALDIPNDRLYALANNQIYQINNISTLNGNGVGATATIPDAGVLSAIAVKQ